MFDLTEVKKQCGIDLVINNIDMGTDYVINRLKRLHSSFFKLAQLVDQIENNPLWPMVMTVTPIEDIADMFTYHDYMVYRASLLTSVNQMERLADHMMMTSICPFDIINHYSIKVHNFFYYA